MSKTLAYLLLFGVVGLLLLGFLKTSPIWYDDTGHWRVVKHFAETGQLCYLLDSETGECDPNSMFITMGPAVQVPARIWMNVFGTSMTSARFFMIPYSLFALLAFLVLSTRLVGREKGLWAVLLVVGNIQFLTYGSQFLGELPVLAWMFLGMWFFVRWLGDQEGKGSNFLGAMVSFLTALACKESALLPIGGGLFLFMMISFFRKDWGRGLAAGFQGLVLGLGWAGLVYFRYLDGDDFWQVWELRQGYQKEFFAFEFGESLRFLAFKPLIGLGMIALFAKMKYRNDPRDWFLGFIFCAQILFFLLSKGYDRFGFQLIFIPAIYLSEFVVFVAKWIQRREKGRLLWQIAGALIFIIVFTQQSLPVLASRLLNPEQVNDSEKCLARELNRLGVLEIFTYDEQIVSFLPEGVTYRLEPMVHVNSDLCQPLELHTGEYLVAGKYARTEYPNCVDWANLERIGGCQMVETPYEVFARKE